MRNRAQFLSGLALLVLLLVHPAWSDGVYIPEVAIENMPAIPVQRALITYRNGTETMVVESGVQTSSPTVGWVLPLPQAPTSISKAEPGTLVSASMALRADIVHELHHPWEPPLWILVLAAPALLAVIFTPDPQARRKRAVNYAVVSLSLVFVWSILLPSLGRSRGGPEGNVDVVSSQRVGSYNIDILSAKSADDLQAWLGRNGLHELSAQARGIVDDYIKRGWCFAVSRLEVHPDAVSTPHPLAFTFPATAPIFPMKLTALAATRTRVEIIVVADQRAQADGFHLACCDRFDTTGSEATCPSKLVLAHPDITRHLWDNCVVSKLQADLEPVAMNADVSLALTPFRAHRDTVYTRQARSEIIAAIILWSLVPVALIMAAACAGMRSPSRGARLTSLAILLAALVSASIFVLSIDVIDDVTITRGRYLNLYPTISVRHAVSAIAAGLHADDPDLAERVIRSLKDDPEAQENNYQGGDRHWERSPGNVCLDEQRQVVLYDLDTVGDVVTDPLPLRSAALPSVAPATQP